MKNLIRRKRFKMYLNVRIYIEKNVFKVYQFGFNSIVKARLFIEKLHSNGIITNP
ncbi:hypothetical protein KACHI17_05000 [Sediminibacterium sp. KACHI17]|uniref:Uncharacterized protein n=1 Tax=Sediminibacterium sp. KACHI17 TaxID=1751071 RepID=A0AAT9GG51_9BACT